MTIDEARIEQDSWRDFQRVVGGFDPASELDEVEQDDDSDAKECRERRYLAEARERAVDALLAKAEDAAQRDRDAKPEVGLDVRVYGSFRPYDGEIPLPVRSLEPAKVSLKQTELGYKGYRFVALKRGEWQVIRKSGESVSYDGRSAFRLAEAKQVVNLDVKS